METDYRYLAMAAHANIDAGITFSCGLHDDGVRGKSNSGYPLNIPFANRILSKIRLMLLADFQAPLGGVRAEDYARSVELRKRVVSDVLRSYTAYHPETLDVHLYKDVSKATVTITVVYTDTDGGQLDSDIIHFRLED